MNQNKYVAEFRAQIDDTDHRASTSARLRPLLPRIQERISAGSPYQAILDDLEEAGLTVSYRTLKESLFRWRKAQQKGHSNPATPTSTLRSNRVPAPLTAAAPIEAEAVQGRPARIETPGDLRKIRDMDIDLDALRREGEAARKAKKQEAKASTNPDHKQE